MGFTRKRAHARQRRESKPDFGEVHGWGFTKCKDTKCKNRAEFF
jgi:hypothetical protein